MNTVCPLYSTLLHIIVVFIIVEYCGGAGAAAVAAVQEEPLPSLLSAREAGQEARRTQVGTDISGTFIRGPPRSGTSAGSHATSVSWGGIQLEGVAWGTKREIFPHLATLTTTRCVDPASSGCICWRSGAKVDFHLEWRRVELGLLCGTGGRVQARQSTVNNARRWNSVRASTQVRGIIATVCWRHLGPRETTRSLPA